MGYVNAVSAFKQGATTSAQVPGGHVVELRWQNGESNLPLGPIKRIVMHWTAGQYDVAENAYHYVVTWDAARSAAHVVKTLNLTQLGEHTWHLNTGSIGVSLACMAPGFPPIAEQVQEAAVLVAELMAWHGLDPHVLGASPEAHLIDHATVGKFLDEDGKIDITSVWPQFLSEVQARYAALKAGTTPFKYRSILADAT